MITCELMGGLGNQLFQIATTIALAKENNDDFCFDIESHNVHWQGNKASIYKNSIYSKLKNGTITPDFVFNENGHQFQKIDYKSNMKLIGYFQSEKYFSKHRDYIIDLFEPNEDISNYIDKKYGDFLGKKTCSLHVRHGDYLTLAAHHQPLQMKYYQQAISHFDNDTLFIVFSDDIEWCKSVFKGDNYIFIENESDIIDLYLMSKCKNNIIANSSFSWWGSWLNKNEDKKVIAPSKWFGPANAHLITDDIYTNKMIKI